jgi:hypothetical protein
MTPTKSLRRYSDTELQAMEAQREIDRLDPARFQEFLGMGYNYGGAVLMFAGFAFLVYPNGTAVVYYFRRLTADEHEHIAFLTRGLTSEQGEGDYFPTTFYG